jgi:site-specific DNA-methyltransferase (adenine-specific)
MSLYYADDFVTLYHGDCLTEHREWLDADVLVTDPPYGIAYESNFQRNKKLAKMGRPVANDATLAARDSALDAWGDRAAIAFGRWDAPRPANTRARLIWDKGNSVGMGDLSFPWGRSEEEIYVLGKGFTGKREGNVIRAQMLMSGDASRPDHPTPKPVGLMERLIEKCPPGVIADPFAGSGATLVAAKNLGRKVLGVELEERYCEIIAKRCAQEVLDIFGGAA